MEYGMSQPMAWGRGQWVVWIWRGHLSRNGNDDRMKAYGDSKLEAIDRALKLRRCLR